LWPKEKEEREKVLYCSSTVAHDRKRVKRVKKKRKKSDTKELSKSAKRYTRARREISKW